MTLYDVQKVLFAAVFRFIVKGTKVTVYGLTSTISSGMKNTSVLNPMHPWKKGFKYKGWGQPIRSFSSCPQLRSVFGLPFKGQGLKKNALVVNKSERLDRFIKNRKSEQEWGRKYVPIFPDILTFVKATVIASSGVIVGWIFYPEFINRNSAINDPTLKYEPAIQLTDKRNLMMKVYLGVPWRALSRAWGRINKAWEIPVYMRPYLFGLYSKVYKVNMDEAVDPDLKNYANFSEFFRRAIKSNERPIDDKADLVSPADGTILHFGRVVNGAVEQVKGLTYSLQKFLGPLHVDPVHDEWGEKEAYKHNWCTVPLPNYMKALMHNPAKNDLYHCVIYLAPGDYHRFHSPAEWVVQHRRHFPGDLLSVNPKIASLVPSLFVLNERVAMLGKWKHGFFSMTAVGATNVGTVEIYGDITLQTNRPKRVYGGFYDMGYEDVSATKGIGIGEFNLGSTIVLIFEAPKDFKYNVKAGEKILYGRALAH